MSNDRAHSRFGGSSAPRWMNCVGSVALNATIPQPAEGPYAREGKAAHYLAETCLRRGTHPAAFIGTEIPHFPGITVSQEMSDAVVEYLNAIETETARSKTSQVFIEQGFELDIPTADKGEVFGTNDCMVYHPELGRLRVFDYKHGVGISVSADDNAQLKFYAAGAIFSHPEWKVREIVTTIVQPRARDAAEAGVVKDWTFSLVELLEFMGDVEAAIGRAKAFERDGHGQDVFNIGAWCDKTFCTAKAAGQCPAVAAEALKRCGMDFAGVKPVRIEEITPAVLPEAKSLDLTQLAKIVDGIEFLSTWANQCREYLEAQLMGGAQAPGWKVVDKIGRAKWVDEPTQVASYADMVFGIGPDQFMPPKIVTITEAEKLLKAAGASKSDIDTFKLKFTIKESSGRTIARSSDTRPAVDVVAADFTGVNVTAIAAE